jgi:hypothetical protein
VDGNASKARSAADVLLRKRRPRKACHLGSEATASAGVSHHSGSHFCQAWVVADGACERGAPFASMPKPMITSFLMPQGRCSSILTRACFAHQGRLPRDGARLCGRSGRAVILARSAAHQSRQLSGLSGDYRRVSRSHPAIFRTSRNYPGETPAHRRFVPRGARS